MAPDEAAIVAQYARAGIVAIAARHGLTFSRVRAILVAHGVTIRHRGITAQGQPRKLDREIEIVELRKQGLTYEAIGALYGISRERVRQILARVGEDLPRPKREGLPPIHVLLGMEPWQYHEHRHGTLLRNNAIAEAYLRGDKTIEIAATYGIESPALYKILRRRNLPLRRPHRGFLSPRDHAMIVGRAAAGESVNSIAADYHCSHDTIRNIARGKSHPRTIKELNWRNGPNRPLGE